MEQDNKMDREWNFSINLSGLNAPTGRKAMDVPEGYYRAVVADSYVNPERNKSRVVFKLTISEGPFKGVVRTDGMNIPRDDEDNVRFYWRGMAESAGYSPAELDAGQIELGPKAFADRTVFIHFTPKDEAAGRTYEKVDYLAPTEWNQQKQVFDAQPAAAPTGPIGSVLGAGNGVSPSGTTTKSAVLNKLGITA